MVYCVRGRYYTIYCISGTSKSDKIYALSISIRRYLNLEKIYRCTETPCFDQWKGAWPVGHMFKVKKYIPQPSPWLQSSNAVARSLKLDSRYVVFSTAFCLKVIKYSSNWLEKFYPLNRYKLNKGQFSLIEPTETWWSIWQVQRPNCKLIILRKGLNPK